MPPSGDVGMYHECVGEGLKGKEARLRDGEKAANRSNHGCDFPPCVLWVWEGCLLGNFYREVKGALTN